MWRHLCPILNLYTFLFIYLFVFQDGGSDNEGGDYDEVDGDTDHIDSEGEEEEEKPKKFTGFTVKNKHG